MRRSDAVAFAPFRCCVGMLFAPCMPFLSLAPFHGCVLLPGRALPLLRVDTVLMPFAPCRVCMCHAPCRSAACSCCSLRAVAVCAASSCRALRVVAACAVAACSWCSLRSMLCGRVRAVHSIPLLHVEAAPCTDVVSRRFHGFVFLPFALLRCRVLMSSRAVTAC